MLGDSSKRWLPRISLDQGILPTCELHLHVPVIIEILEIVSPENTAVKSVPPLEIGQKANLSIFLVVPAQEVVEIGIHFVSGLALDLRALVEIALCELAAPHGSLGGIVASLVIAQVEIARVLPVVLLVFRVQNIA